MHAPEPALFLTGKRDSRRHSMIVVTQTSCQMLEVLLFCDLKRAHFLSLTITVFCVRKNGKMKLSKVSNV